MGGVININPEYHCCIHDSNFKKDDKQENIETIEKEALKLGSKAIDRAESFFTEFSPSRKHSKEAN